ncbi:MAG: hypothetical protein K2X03_02255 [Bryobacteraceae bacterium]|nr:hypothetical protein [Bryobacteraceae bacterium]
MLVAERTGEDNKLADSGIDLDSSDTRMPSDLQEALDDAESLLLATGKVMFDVPEGHRLFTLPTDRIM